MLFAAACLRETGAKVAGLGEPVVCERKATKRGRCPAISVCVCHAMLSWLHCAARMCGAEICVLEPMVLGN